MPQQAPLILHASAGAWEGKAVLITGASGSGKSSLALDLMAYGADLVGDDRVQLQRHGALLKVSAVEQLADLIEARGIGILKARSVQAATVRLCVDLDQREGERLPAQRVIEWMGVAVPCIFKVQNDAFPAAILQYLKGGLADI